jgi:tetrahydromethanopterin S-methyltransferase subunit A
MADRLTAEERKAKDRFVRAVEMIMLDLDAKEVGRIADYVGEHGTDGDGGTREDATVVECLRIIVDEMGRKQHE